MRKRTAVMLCAAVLGLGIAGCEGDDGTVESPPAVGDAAATPGG